MVVHEFRIPMPLTVEEFGRGQLYMVAKVSAEFTQAKEGVEWLKNEPFDNTDGHMGVSSITGTPVPKIKGQYTVKRYLLESKVPGIVKHLLPSNALFLLEEAWNGFPYCLTVLINGYLDRNKMRIVVETMHLDGDATAENNALKLGKEDLAARKVETLDIAGAGELGLKPGATPDPTLDARHFKSSTTGRGPLAPGWQAPGKTAPMMTAYKLVRADFKYFGLQTKIENGILNEQRELFMKTHAKAFCTMDEWAGKSIEDIRALEAEVAAKAQSQLAATLKETAAIPAPAAQ